MKNRSVYLTQVELDAPSLGTIVHGPMLAQYKRVVDGWRPCSLSGQAQPSSDTFASWQLASEGVTL